MTHRAIVSISCVGQAGLLGAVAARLFELGCNLADTTFANLAGSAEFTTVCELPAGLAPADEILVCAHGRVRMRVWLRLAGFRLPRRRNSGRTPRLSP